MANGEGDREAVEGLVPPDPVIYQRAAVMRRSMTPPEARLWSRLKGGQLEGFKFRRQHPVGRYILDFYCSAAKVAIEVDGAVHDVETQVDHDRARTAWLDGQGIRVLRFPALAMRDEMDGVLDGIRAAVSGR